MVVYDGGWAFMLMMQVEERDAAVTRAGLVPAALEVSVRVSTKFVCRCTVINSAASSYQKNENTLVKNAKRIVRAKQLKSKRNNNSPCSIKPLPNDGAFHCGFRHLHHAEFQQGR